MVGVLEVVDNTGSGVFGTNENQKANKNRHGVTFGSDPVMVTFVFIRRDTYYDLWQIYLCACNCYVQDEESKYGQDE